MKSQSKAIVITSAILTINISGCHHLQFAKSPLPVVYHDEASTQDDKQPSVQHAGKTIRLPKNKPIKKGMKERYLYILENWF